MAYADQSRRPNLAGLTAAVAIQGGIVAALVLGLSVTTGVIERPDRLPVFDIPKDVPPPPPEPEIEPDPTPTDQAPTSPPVTAPEPKLDLRSQQPPVNARDIVLPPNPPTTTVRERVAPIPTPTPTITPTPPAFDPVAARPRNNPAEWVTTSDYRSAWIRREMTGTAQFRLDIAANGQVENCRITRSTGHSALDQATCSLIQKRARFEPARNASGDAVTGSYASAIRWDLPE